jgi:hypothetical protein
MALSPQGHRFRLFIDPSLRPLSHASQARSGLAALGAEWQGTRTAALRRPWPSAVGGWRRLTGWVVLASLGVIGFGDRARAEGSPAPAAGPIAAAPPVVAAQAGAAPVGSVESHPRGKRSHQGFFLRLSLGTTYLRESWNPSGGTPGTVYSGWGPSLETSVGKSIRPGLVLGGRWQFATVVDPNQSFAGGTYVVTQTARFVDIVSFFVDHYPDPRRGFHWGGSVGAVAITDLDAYFGTAANGWGAALAAHVGYERYFSSRWSVGVLGELNLYRDWSTVAGVSAVSDGLAPTVALAFTFE